MKQSILKMHIILIVVENAVNQIIINYKSNLQTTNTANQTLQTQKSNTNIS